MANVQKVFITKEAADLLGLTPTYLIRVAKSFGFTPEEFREAGKRNYLFSEEAILKLKKHFNGDK